MTRDQKLLLDEINAALEKAEPGSVAQQRLLAQKMELIKPKRRNRKPKAVEAPAVVQQAPKTPMPAAAPAEGADEKGTFHRFEGYPARKPINYQVQLFCGDCHMFVYGRLFENSLEHDPADLPRAMESHSRQCHAGMDFFREPPEGN